MSQVADRLRTATSRQRVECRRETVPIESTTDLHTKATAEASSAGGCAQCTPYGERYRA